MTRLKDKVTIAQRKLYLTYGMVLCLKDKVRKLFLTYGMVLCLVTLTDL